MARRTNLNFATSVLYQLINLLIGLFLPKLYTETFGSVYNGLNQAVSQTMSVLAVLQFGISAASIQLMFQYIAKNNEEMISAVYWNTGKQYRKMGYVFLLILFPLVLMFPHLIKDDLPNRIIVAFLLLRTVGTVLEYFFQAKYGVLLIAYGQSYIIYVVNILLLLLSTLLHVLVLFTMQNILLYQSVAVIISCVRFLIMHAYINRKYPFIKRYRKAIEIEEQRHKRSDVLVSEIAGLIVDSTDILLLSMFSGLVNASIYSVYSFVTSGLANILSSCREAVFAGIGQSYYSNFEDFKKKMSRFESVYFFLTFYLYTTAILLFRPFIEAYTAKMDVQYMYAGLPILFIMAKLIVNLRIPSIVAVNTAGHFKQVKYYAVLEAAVNLIVSLVLVAPWGLHGVLVGTILGGAVRTPILINYANRNILKRENTVFLKKFATWLPLLIICYVVSVVKPLNTSSLTVWILMAMPIAGILLLVFVVWACLFDKEAYAEIKTKVQFRRG